MEKGTENREEKERKKRINRKKSNSEEGNKSREENKDREENNNKEENDNKDKNTPEENDNRIKNSNTIKNNKRIKNSNRIKNNNRKKENSDHQQTYYLLKDNKKICWFGVVDHYLWFRKTKWTKTYKTFILRNAKRVYNDLLEKNGFLYTFSPDFPILNRWHRFFNMKIEESFIYKNLFINVWIDNG